jgi:hypothetical protein
LATPLVVTVKMDEKIKLRRFGDGKLLKYSFEKKKKINLKNTSQNDVVLRGRKKKEKKRRKKCG